MSEICICQHPRPAADTLKCVTCNLAVLQTPVIQPTIAELCRPQEWTYEITSAA
jgi:hypothetical protein